MKAVMCYGDNNLRLEDIPKPRVVPGHALVNVKACGICGTDASIFSGDGPPWTKYPIVPGHELSGIVEEVYEGTSDLQPGCPVAIDNYLRCGACWYCKNGHYFLCDHHSEVGMTINGGFEEYSLIPTTNLVKVPDGLSVETAVLTEPVATALRACREATIVFGENVVVLGCGPLGVLISQIAKVMGANVTLVGRGRRLERVRKMSPDACIDSSQEDWEARVRENVGQAGVDVLFDVTGSEKLLLPSTRLMRKKGRLVLLGLTAGKNGEIPFDDVVLNEIDIIGRVSGMGYFEEALRLLSAGKLDLSIITHRFPLERFEDAVRYDRERIEGALKVALVQ